MKINKLIKKIALTTSLVLVTAVLAAVAVKPALAIPYEGDATPGLSYPAFNVYTGTPSVGDEADFFKGKVETDSTYVSDVSSACAAGTRFSLRVYVHNAANQNLNENGNGPGVAHNTKVRVSLPSNEATSFTNSAVITSSNASSVSDSMTIDCNGRKVALEYVAGTAKQFTVPGGTQSLSDSIVTTGAPIGTNSPNGDVWGCWDQRVWVTLVVTVKESPTPPPTPPKPPVTPPVLPDTGAGDVIGIFAGVSIIGAVLHRLFLVRFGA